MVTGKDHDGRPAPFSLHISQDPFTGSGTTSNFLEWNSMIPKGGPFKHSEFVQMTQHWLTCQNLPLICADFAHGHALSSPAAHDPCPSLFLCHDCPVHWLHCCSQTQGTVRYGYGNCHLTCRTLIQKVPLLCFKKWKISLHLLKEKSENAENVSVCIHDKWTSFDSIHASTTGISEKCACWLEGWW